MQKSITAKTTDDDSAQLKAAINECDAAMVRVLKRIKKDQAAIEKLKKETRSMLNALKAA